MAASWGHWKGGSFQTGAGKDSAIVQHQAKSGPLPERIRQLEERYPTMRFNDATKKQVDAARRFAAEHNTSVSQATKHLKRYFAYRNGEISIEELNALV